MSSYEVELHNVGGSLIQSTCTAGDGTYTLGGLATGSYEVRFSGDPGPCGAQADYAAEWWNDHYSRTFADPVAVTDGQDTGAVNASLEAGSHIQGTVTAGATGLALKDVTVQVLDFTGVSVLTTACASGSGFYSAGPLSAGIYVVKFDPAGSCGDAGGFQLQYYDESPTLVSADPVNLSPGQTLGGINGKLLAGASPSLLTVVRAGTGSGSVSSNPFGISCPDTCFATFAAGTPVTLTATPANGSTFTGWTGGGCSGTGDCTVTMNADASVVATFTAATGGPPPGGSNPPPSGSTPPPGSVSRPPACRLAVKSARVAKRGRLKLTFTCDQAATLSLTGTVTERIAKTKRTKRFRVKTVRSAATAGRAGTLTVTLPAAAVRGLHKRKRSASFTLLAQNTNGQSKTTAKVARLRG